MYSGHIHVPTMILEVVAFKDLWIWHAFFGLPGSHNDIKFYNGLHYLQSYVKVKHLKLIFQSMDMIIKWDTILPMAFIHLGKHL
jgi:hypothetical protein